MPEERIQKILASAGFGSRRACEELVAEGRVSVNGRVVRDLPLLVDPRSDAIRVDRKLIRHEKLVYFMLNKPPGVYCTNTDPDGRTRAIDLLKGVRERVFPVGRLDADSMGLLIMTNDGELTQKLTHPKFQTPKTYRAEVKGRPTDGDLERLRKGIWLSEGRTAPAVINVIHRDHHKTILEITLREGRNREIRRMLAKFGYRVRRLTRIRMGKLSTRKLPLGGFRALTDSEVRYLHKLASGGADENDPMYDVRRRRSSRGSDERRQQKRRRGSTRTQEGEEAPVGGTDRRRRSGDGRSATGGPQKRGASKTARRSKKTGTSKQTGTAKKSGGAKKTTGAKKAGDKKAARRLTIIMPD